MSHWPSASAAARWVGPAACGLLAAAVPRQASTAMDAVRAMPSSPDQKVAHSRASGRSGQGPARAESAGAQLCDRPFGERFSRPAEVAPRRPWRRSDLRASTAMLPAEPAPTTYATAALTHRGHMSVTELRLPVAGPAGQQIEQVPDRAEIVPGVEGGLRDPEYLLLLAGESRAP